MHACVAVPRGSSAGANWSGRPVAFMYLNEKSREEKKQGRGVPIVYVTRKFCLETLTTCTDKHGLDMGSRVQY